MVIEDGIVTKYKKVTVIGGANMDINGFSHQPLNMTDSNPGRVEYCPGGVGRNIAENLHRLGADVSFIGVIGDDPGGELLKTSSARMGLNIEHSLFLNSIGPKNANSSSAPVTSVYIALMDNNGEMKLALSDMDIMEEMTEEHLDSKAGIIQESAIVVLDTNLPKRIICYILDKFGSAGPQFFLDPVSARKAPRAASRIGFFDTLKLGYMEASALSGVEIPSEKSSPQQRKKLEEAAASLIEKGVRRVFISLGTEGVYTVSMNAVGDKKSFFSPVRYVPPLNTSGGGDSFMAGIIYGTLCGWDDESIVSFSMAMARITVQSKYTVSPEMSLELVKREQVSGNS